MKLASFSLCSLTAHLNLTLRGITKAKSANTHAAPRSIFCCCQVLQAFCNSCLIPGVVMDPSLELAVLTGLGAQCDFTNLQERCFNLWQTQPHCSFTTYKTLIITALLELLYWRDTEWQETKVPSTHQSCIHLIKRYSKNSNIVK